MAKELFITDIKIYYTTIIIINKKWYCHRKRPVGWNGLESSETH